MMTDEDTYVPMYARHADCFVIIQHVIGNGYFNGANQFIFILKTSHFEVFYNIWSTFLTYISTRPAAIVLKGLVDHN